MFVWLYVHFAYLENHTSKLQNFFVHVACGHCSVLLQQQCTHTQPFYSSLDFVLGNPGELVKEGTFCHLLDFLVKMKITQADTPWRFGVVLASHERSCSTLGLVSTGMGDHLRAGIPPRYVTKPTRSTQPWVAKSSTGFNCLG